MFVAESDEELLFISTCATAGGKHGAVSYCLVKLQDKNLCQQAVCCVLVDRLATLVKYKSSQQLLDGLR